jgi:TetR/AcrR family transcriptional regulator, transcriptional repressor for nem operon
MKKKGTRESLIEVGLELIRSTGYTATGINQIVDTADARSFYDYFTSKDQFVIEVIKFYVARVQGHMERMLADSSLSPLDKLRRYFEDMIATQGRSGGQITGCLLGNLSLEVAGHNMEIRDLLRQSFDDWQKAIAKTIREAIDRGELHRTAKANDLAAVIVDSWEGAQVRAKAEQSDKAFHLFFDNAFNVLLKTDSL